MMVKFGPDLRPVNNEFYDKIMQEAQQAATRFVMNMQQQPLRERVLTLLDYIQFHDRTMRVLVDRLWAKAVAPDISFDTEQSFEHLCEVDACGMKVRVATAALATLLKEV